LTLAGGQFLDKHFRALGLDHRELGFNIMKLHQQVIRQMAQEAGLPPGALVLGVYGLGTKQDLAMVNFLHPADRNPGHPRSASRAARSTGSSTPPRASRELLVFSRSACRVARCVFFHASGRHINFRLDTTSVQASLALTSVRASPLLLRL
jgi:hypothetical protein